MKPFELIAALMAREGLGALPLAKKIGREKLQPQIHRYMNGQVTSPKMETARPIAHYFNLPVEALYDEKIATAIATERDLKVIVRPPPRSRQPLKAGVTDRVAEVLQPLAAADQKRVLDFARKLAAPKPDSGDSGYRRSRQRQQEYEDSRAPRSTKKKES